MTSANSLWGDKETKFFYDLTPEKILDCVEETGLRCTGRVLALNSLENRVYEVEIIPDSEILTPSDKFRVIKFYRPGRWSQEQILEEHSFLEELQQQDIPVVAPQKFSDGSTIRELSSAKIYFTVFPKSGGRIPDEISNEQAEQIGRLLARLHNVGAAHPAKYRLRLDAATYGRSNLEYLLENNLLPDSCRHNFENCVNEIIKTSELAEKELIYQRIHGDLHLGNLLMDSYGPKLVDFDDHVMGPAIQDLWLLTPARDEYTSQTRELIVQGYEQMRPFPRNSLKYIEIFRALRLINFSSWIARRREDPAFKRVFSDFGSERYWQGQVADLRDQLLLIREDCAA